MNKKILITLFAAILFIAIVFIVRETFSYFSDKKVIEGNIFRVESLE